jgi:hypothetical protein
MSFFDNLFGGAPYDTMAGGYDQGEGAINSATGKAVGYLSPYDKIGRSALGEEYSTLNQAKDPESFINMILSHYQASPAAQFQQKQGINALENQAAATGFTGSGQELKDISKFSQGIASQGQQQWLSNILGARQSFLGGLRGLGLQGQQAATGMGGYQMQGASDLASLMAAKAKAQAQGQAADDSGFGSMFGDFLGSKGGQAALSSLALML